MKAIKAFGLMISLGGMLVALNLGGVAGCGDDTGGGGGGGSGIVNEQAATSALVTALSTASSFGTDDSSAALVADLKSQTTTLDCDSGTITITSTSEDVTIDFASCVFDTDLDGDMNDEVLFDGIERLVPVSDTVLTIEFDDLLMDLAECGGFVFNGTETVTIISDTQANLVMDLNVTSGGDSFNIDGDLDSNSTTNLLNGTITYSGDISANCVFVNTDASICPEVADACGISTADICVGDDYQSFEDLCL